MTIVLVHGNPETEAIWDDLVPHLRSDDVVRLSPPGFGCPIPPALTVRLALIATGSPANSERCHNRSIS
jgi:pimeloyl-ACP methyl ester carboxylesterase